MPSPTKPVRRSLGQRLADAVVDRFYKLPPPTGDYAVTRDVRVPMRDGVVLLADHLAPDGPASGTVLVRMPYGFGAAFTALVGSPFATRGHHVVLVRCRGTYGSGGEFEPFTSEVDDAADTVAWLRGQPWFDGRLATYGGSYGAFTQWALLMDPPPELVTAVPQISPHDMSRTMYPGGGFALDTALSWSDQVVHQEQRASWAKLSRVVAKRRRRTAAMATLPVADAVDGLTGGRAPWYRQWATRRDRSDPYWSPMRLGPALDRVRVPVLLQTGWQDLFLEQTLEQYRALRGRGAEVALTVGPWTHVGSMARGSATTLPEVLDWLAAHLARTGERTRPEPVRVFVTGADRWLDLPEWPPPAVDRVLHPLPGGGLGATPAPAGTPPATFTYDPADPTPTVGGRLLGVPESGYADDTALAARADVLTFTGPVLTESLDVLGAPVVELAHTSDNPHADLFVRISEVHPRGASRNVTEGFLRLDPRTPADRVHLRLDDIAHRFTAGSRVRLLVAGGSFPRFDRNLGTAQDPATSTALAPSRRAIDLSASRVVLPVRP
ncbi:CocE/NonD family hydrolase [Actinokineospora sp. G85]|uniref:CocE/NonD family hydrolase n=1 Tax=Actinokineospora sp. G85 TaxID=3406626 RepID=UPI003C7218C6